VRGGLVFTTGIVITPRQPLNDARLYLGNGVRRRRDRRA
jgi:hypothetical protein